MSEAVITLLKDPLQFLEEHCETSNKTLRPGSSFVSRFTKKQDEQAKKKKDYLDRRSRSNVNRLQDVFECDDDLDGEDQLVKEKPKKWNLIGRIRNWLVF